MSHIKFMPRSMQITVWRTKYQCLGTFLCIVSIAVIYAHWRIHICPTTYCCSVLWSPEYLWVLVFFHDFMMYTKVNNFKIISGIYGYFCFYICQLLIDFNIIENAFMKKWIYTIIQIIISILKIMNKQIMHTQQMTICRWTLIDESNQVRFCGVCALWKIPWKLWGSCDASTT